MGIRNYDAEKMFRAIVKMQTTPAQRVANGLPATEIWKLICNINMYLPTKDVFLTH